MEIAFFQDLKRAFSMICSVSIRLFVEFRSVNCVNSIWYIMMCVDFSLLNFRKQIALWLFSEKILIPLQIISLVFRV